MLTFAVILLMNCCFALRLDYYIGYDNNKFIRRNNNSNGLRTGRGLIDRVELENGKIGWVVVRGTKFNRGVSVGSSTIDKGMIKQSGGGYGLNHMLGDKLKNGKTGGKLNAFYWRCIKE